MKKRDLTGYGDGCCVTVMVFGEPLIPAAATVTVAVRTLPVPFGPAVMMKLSGEVPLTGATASQLTPSLTVQLNEELVPQFVTKTEVVSPPTGASQLLFEIHNVAGIAG